MALWMSLCPGPQIWSSSSRRVTTRPAGALAAARRHELPMAPVAPRRLTDVLAPEDLVVAVCDNAYEEMRSPVDWLHWSIPDPGAQTDERAFDHAIAELDERIFRLLPALTANQTSADPPST
jgi:protein-tyrosine-phosphatase